MLAVSGQQNLFLLNRRFYFRKAIPKELVVYLGRSEYKKSLGTGSYKEACRLLWALNTRIEAFFEVVHTMTKILDRDTIKEFVRTYFENCLIDGENILFFERHLVKSDQQEEYNPAALVSMAAESKEYLRTLTTLLINRWSRRECM